MTSRQCQVHRSLERVTIESIRQACDIEDGHWIWKGRVRYYGAPCMAVGNRDTRPVRQVIYRLMNEGREAGMPLLPRCGNPLCVAPACIFPRRHADLMTEGRMRKSESVLNSLLMTGGMWDQLMIVRRR